MAIILVVRSGRRLVILSRTSRSRPMDSGRYQKHWKLLRRRCSVRLAISWRGEGVLLSAIEHYPPSDFEPAITDLAKFLSPEDCSDTRSRLLLGNGASEMIDMISRLAPKGPWRPGERRESSFQLIIVENLSTVSQFKGSACVPFSIHLTSQSSFCDI